MREHVESVSAEGRVLRVVAREPLPAPPRVLALAAALRVFGRYPVFVRLTLSVGPEEVSVTREDVAPFLGPDGFTALESHEGWRQVLGEIVRHGEDRGAR